MGRPVVTFTDYSTPCGDMPQSFYEMLQNATVTYNGHCYLNLIAVYDYCDDLTSCTDCDNNMMEPERFLVENLFALDECGNLGLKVFVNYGAGVEQ